MKKNLFCRIMRLALSLCLIIAISLTGVVLDSTGIFGAITGSGTSSNPYVSDTPIEIEKGETKNNSLYTSLKGFFGDHTFSVDGVSISSSDSTNVVELSDGEHNVQWKEWSWSSFKNVMYYGKVTISNYYNFNVSIANGKTVKYNGTEYANGSTIKIFEGQLPVTMEIPAPEGDLIASVACSDFTTTVTSENGIYYVTLNDTDNSESGQTLSVSYEEPAPVNIKLTSNRPAYGDIYMRGTSYPSDLDQDIISGSNITLQAVPKAGCHFYGWELNGTRVSTDAEYVISVKEAAEYKALFYSETDTFAFRHNNKYYLCSDLDVALEAAKSHSTDKTVVMVESGTIDDTVTENGVITIPDGVTLLLPYAKGYEDVTLKNTDHPYMNGNYIVNNKLPSCSANQTMVLTVEADENNTTSIVVSENAKLVLGGIIGSNNSGFSGQTAGDHSDIYLGNNCEIKVASGGILSSCGYITGDGNVSIVGGSVYVPFVIHDFRGGTYTDVAYNGKKISPFNHYSVRNIQVDMEITTGGSMYGYCDLYAGLLSSSHNKTTSRLIGLNSSSAVIKTNTNTIVDIDYNPNDLKKQVRSYIDDIRITIKNGADFGSLELNVMNLITVSTSEVIFPLPYIYSFYLEDGTYNVEHDYKIMPGAEVHVGNNGILNLSGELQIYDGYPIKEHDLYASTTYPSSNELATKGYSETGRLVINGRLNVSEGAVLSGIVETNSINELPGNVPILDIKTTSFQSVATDGVKKGDSGRLKPAPNGNFTSRTLLGKVFDKQGNSIELTNDIYYGLAGGGFKDSYTYEFNADVGAGSNTISYTGITENPGKAMFNGAWTREATLTFDLEGKGTLLTGVDAVQTRYTGLALGELPVPTRDGYIFSHWYYKDADESEVSVNAETLMPNADTTLYAKWTAHTYTVQFDANKGTGTMEPQGRVFDDGVALSANTFGRDGYTFVGWNTVADGSGTSYAPGFSDNITSEDGATLMLYAQWKANSYTVTFNADGGTAESGSSLDAVTKEFDAPYGDLPVVSKEGYTFDGWYLGNNKIESTINVTTAEDHTLKAKWIAHTYTFHFEGNEADSGSMEDQVFSYGTPANIRECGFKKTGYHFDGWASSEAGAVVYSDKQEISNLTKEDGKEYTLYAKWAPNTYTVNFDGNGNINTDAAIEEQGFTYDKEQALPANVFEKTGHKFLGWSTDTNATEAEYTDGEKVSNLTESGSITLYAVWEIRQYTITFDTNGGSTVDAVSGDFGSGVTAPADPTKTGYTFAGWDTEIPATMPAKDMTIKAKWTVNQYNYSFVVDGEKIVSGTIDYGTAITKPAVPTKKGYTFTGWDPEVPATMPAENQTFTARWQIKQYTISFANTGDTAINDIKQDYGTAVEKPANPTKTGYTFAGWDKDIPDTIPAENVTINASWTANEYDVKFFNGDVKLSEEKVTFGTALGDLPEGPEKEGYTFAGWYTEENGQGEKATDATVLNTEGANYYAHWTVNQYTITFANTGDSVIENITEDYGTVIPNIADPVRTGYTFDGWDKDIPATMPAENVTITAQWTKNKYNVHFVDKDGNNVAPSIEVEYGGTIVAPTNPQKEGYTFVGWEEYNTTMPAVDVTIASEWKINEYTIIFDTDGGNEIASIKQDYNSTVTAPADPTKTGYTFAGWEPAVPSTMPAENITVKAKWTPNLYTITFDTVGGSEIENITQGYNTTVAKPADPTKEGYTFDKWVKVNAGGEEEDIDFPSTMPLNGLSLKAVWIPNTYTVKYEKGVDDVSEIKGSMADQTHTYDLELPLLEIGFTRPGHSFEKWARTDESGNEIAYYNNGATVENLTSVDNGVVSLIAKWAIESYTFAFDPNGGKFADGNTAVKEVAAKYGESVAVPTDPIQTGHRFDGWTDSAGNAYEVPTIMPDLGMNGTKIALTAQWLINQYTITFANTGDSVIEDITEDYGTVIPNIADPVRTGYTFTGWDKELPITMPAEDQEITATWNANDYNVSFVVDGASYDTPVTVKYDSAYGSFPADPQKEGYTFKGWQINGEGNFISKDSTVSLAEDHTLIAKLDANKYKLSLHFWEGHSPATVEKTVTYDGNYGVLDEVNTSRPGYSFKGWYTKEGDPVKSDDVVHITSDTEFYGKWEMETYEINYDLGVSDGEFYNNPNPGGYSYVENGTININAPTREGYTFAGWTSEVLAITKPTKAVSFAQNREDDVDLKAHWTINQYTITFDTNGGSAVTAITSDYGTAVTAPADPEREGYTFAGWDVEVPATMPAENVTITAHWTVNQYTYTFVVDSETEKSEAVNYGSAIVAPENPTKEGYTFKGWTPEVPDTMPAKDQTFTAQWGINSHNVTFVVDGETVKSETVKYGEVITKPADPQKDGYTFIGWTEVPETMPDYAVTITAQWEINQYTITFANTGDTVIDAITADYGIDVAAPADPVKEGYTFAGWDKEIPSNMPAEDITITASWTINQYTITFENTGDTVINPIMQDYGTNVMVPGDPEKEGHTFAGWDVEVPATMPAKNLTIKAQWTVNSYPLVINNGSEQTTKKVAFGASIADAAGTPEAREGYTFKGWYPDESFSEALGADAVMTTEGAEIFAKWDANKIALTLDANSGTFADGEKTRTINVYYDALYDLPGADDISREGHTFRGWTKTKNTDDFVENNSIIKETDESRTLYASWSKNSYHLIFENGYNEQDKVSTPIIYGSDINANEVKPANPTREGYTFDGWDTEIPSTMPANDVVIKAKWKINQYTLTFNTDGGNEIAPIKQDYNTVVKAPADPTKEGYTFKGWSPEVPATMPAEDQTITAQWEINQYTLTFDTNGGSTVDAVSGDFGSGVTAPAYPTKTGYTFAGWDTEIPATMPAKDMTIKAKWTINDYTITFANTGDTVIAPITQNYGTAVTAPADPEREGYTFAGWDVEVPATMPAQDVTITAQWTVNQYSITFDANGGSDVDAITADYGTAVTAPADPTRTGYTFKGWDKEIPATMPASDQTITAQWEINRYTITFDTVGGSEIAAITQNYNTAVTKPANPTKPGYTFAGWDKEIPTTMPADDLTITAKWTVNQYTITFDTDGGTDVASITQDYGTKVTTPQAPTKVGHDFVGWDTEIPGIMPAKNLTIKAQWKINQYTISFNSAGGNSVSAIKQDYGTAVTAPADPSRTGYTFMGWEPALPATMPADNMTLTAQWKINRYTITFDSDGGTAVEPLSVDYKGAVTAPTAPTKTGYAFVAWSPALPVSMPAENMEVKAKWKINTYTIYLMDGANELGTISAEYLGAVQQPDAPKKAGYRFDNWEPAIPETMPVDGLKVQSRWTSYLDLLTAITIDDINKDDEALAEARGYYMQLNDNQKALYATDPNYTEHKNALFERIRVVSIEEMRDEVMASKDETNDCLNIAHATCPEGDHETTEACAKQPIAAMEIYNDPDHLGEGYIDATIYLPEYKALGMLSIPFLSTMFPFDPEVKKVVQIGDRPEYPLSGETDLLKSDQFNIMFDIAWYAMEPEMTKEEFYDHLYGQMNTITIGVLDNEIVPVKIIGTSPEGVEFVLNYDIHFFNNVHTVTWVNGDEETTSNVAYGTKFLGLAPAVTNIGYTFVGWNTRADGEGAALPEAMGKTDATYYAQWDANQYTVSLISGSEGTVEKDKITVTYGEPIVGLPDAVPNSDRHVFAGWTCGGKDYSNDMMVDFAEDVTFIAKWEIDVFRISYDLGGGSVATANPVTYKAESESFTLNNPSKTGYTFLGWTGTGLTEPATEVTIAKGSSGDRSYTANWKINSYDLTFDAKGGAFEIEGNPKVIASKVKYQDAVSAPNDPVRIGYTFNGWDKEIPATMPAEDVTISAKWTVNQYTITFDTDGGSAIASRTQNYGSPITAPAAPEKEGYTFMGWVNADGEPCEIPSSMPAENVTVKAAWQINQYSITFDNGVPGITQDFGTAVTKPEDPVKVGYTFHGWLTEGGESYEIPATMPAENVKLTAKWVANTYDVILNPGAGSVDPETVSVTYDAVYGELPVPVREGYEFVGWFDENEQPVLATTFVKITENQTLFATWNAKGDIPYTVNHYQQDISGDGYTKVDTENLTGATEAEVNASYRADEGFHVNESLGNVSGVITADGKLELNVYYDRDVHSVTWIVRGGETIIESYRYGATPVCNDTAWETDIHASYEFIGWEPAVESVTTDVTYTAQYHKTYEAAILGDPDITYGKLSDALVAAKANDVIRLDKDITLDESLTVPAGVTLLLSCMDDDPGYVYHESYTGAQLFNPNGGDETKNPSQGVGPKAKLYRKLTVPDGITLTVEGTVMVNAVTGRPSAGDYDQDITGGYAQIDLGGNIVVANGGTFENFGYVKGSGMVTAKNGGNVGDLYIVRSWRGGSQGLEMYEKDVYPMNEYDMHNIEADVRVEYGASYYGLVKMYASGEYHYTRFPQIDVENGLIRSTEEDSYVICSYDAESGYENYSLYGGGNFGSSTLTAAGFTLSSAQVFYPWDGDITFDLYDGTYHFIENKAKDDYFNGFKFLTGGGITVHSEADLIVDTGVQVVFYQEFKDKALGETQYPTDRAPAVLTVKRGASFINAGSFGGHIYTESPDILIGASPVWGITTQEAAGFTGGADGVVDIFNDLSITRPGYDWKFGKDLSIVWIGADYTAVEKALEKVPKDLDPYSSETRKAVENAVNQVIYDLPKSDQDKVNRWAKDIEDAVAALKYAVVSVSFDPCDGTLAEEIILTKTYGDTYGALPVPTLDGYTFIGWYTGITGGTKISDTSVVAINGDHTLYARYSKIEDKPALPGDYTELDQAIEKVPADLNGYTDVTVKALNTALNAVERGLTEERQGDIDAWTQNILDAISALQPRIFTVTYEPCGGKMVGRTFKVTYGQTFGEMESPSREHYVFDAWYTSAEGGDLVTAETVMTYTTDITIYAHWIQVDADYSKVDEALALIPDDFEIYYDKESVDNINNAVNAVVWGLGAESQAQIDQWAKDIRRAWNARKGVQMNIYYNANGGKVDKYGKTVRYAATYGSLPAPTHSAGYEFLGWYTDKVGGTLIKSDTKVNTIENHTLYAHWEMGAADYSAVNAAIERIPADLSGYTELSVKAVLDAKNAVEYDLGAEYQDAVNAWAVAINKAVDGLVAVSAGLPFTDVPEGSWYYDTIYTLYHAGIVSGMTDTSYGPNLTTTRAQMATLLYRISGSPSHQGYHPFTDVSADKYYYDAICWGYECDVLKGVSVTLYDPDAPITREQFAAMLYRLSGNPQTNGSLDDFVDAGNVSGYAVDAITWCVEVDIINGVTPTTLEPRSEATRAQVATMLLRYMNLQQ